MSWKTFFILLDSTNVAISSLNILSMTDLISIIDPGNMQHSLFLASVLGKSTFNVEEEVFHFFRFVLKRKRVGISF